MNSSHFFNLPEMFLTGIKRTERLSERKRLNKKNPCKFFNLQGKLFGDLPMHRETQDPSDIGIIYQLNDCVKEKN